MRPERFHRIIGPWAGGPWLLTHDARLLAFLEHDGRDPDGRDEQDYLAEVATLANARAALPRDASIQQYQLHYRCPPPAPAPRHHAAIDRLLQARHQHLESKTLYRTRLLTVVSIDTHARSAGDDWLATITWSLAAPFSAEARARVRRALSFGKQKYLLRDAITSASARLHECIDRYRDRLSINDHFTTLQPDAAWAWARVLANLDPDQFVNAGPAPVQSWSQVLSRSTPTVTRTNHVDHWVEPTRGTLARIAALTRFGDKTAPGFWVRGSRERNLLNVHGQYLIATNARPLGKIEEAMQWQTTRNDLARSRLSLGRILSQIIERSGTTPDPELERQRRELDVAEGAGDAWWRSALAIVAFDDSVDAVRRTALAIDTAAASQAINLTWESPLLLDAHRAILPGATPLPPRAHLHNTTQTSATAVTWSHSQGVSAVSDLGGEEPLYHFETNDGQLFGFSPWLGEKSMVIAVGPTRSGKTFLKNALASHMPKYRGMVAALDYDAGSECLYHLYRDDAALFTARAGLNPFSAYTPGRDAAFRAHFSRLMVALLASNDDPLMRRLDAGEQVALDRALSATLALPGALQTLAHFVSHLPSTLAQKFSRWHRHGEARYADLLDATTDRVGMIDRLVTIFNLTALGEDPAARVPVVLELLYRITSAFEDPTRIARPKVLMLDEVHRVIADPQFGPWIEHECRTLAKFRASIWMLTQAPEELARAGNWDAIRDAASTYLFTGSPELVESNYLKAFPRLTPMDLQTIRTLTPKREAYLIQPESGLRKIVVLDPDPATRQFASSTAVDVANRQGRDIDDLFPAVAA